VNYITLNLTASLMKALLISSVTTTVFSSDNIHMQKELPEFVVCQ